MVPPQRAPELGPTIRAIRKAHRMTTAELAVALKVDQSMISRYEAGKRVPGEPVLLRLLPLARGDEKSPILAQLSIRRGRPVMEAEAFLAAEAAEAEFAAIKREMEILTDARPNMARFAYLAPAILHAQKEIDASLNAVLQLWLSTPDFPEKAQCFRDAALFLEIALSRAALGSRGEKQRYRVIYPVDLGDGVQREAGEIVDLTAAAAAPYSHALCIVESDATEQRRSG